LTFSPNHFCPSFIEQAMRGADIPFVFGFQADVQIGAAGGDFGKFVSDASARFDGLKIIY